MTIRRNKSFRSRALLATALSLSALMGAAPAFAQDDGDDELVVTGTRLPDRTVTTSPAPIDVLRGDDLRASGYFETNQILRQLTPSFAFATPTTPDGNTHIRSASLRGLSPDSTLVLVNGQRIHSSAWINTSGTIGKGAAPTDLNQIPAAAIGRIEVLRDGAAAQYGADAIAGVINIILRGDDGWSSALSYGATQDGGGDTYEASLHGGFSVLGDGQLNATLYYRDHEAANRALPDTRQQYFGISPTSTLQPLSARWGSGIGLNPPGGVAGTTLDPRESTIDRNVFRFADSADLTDGSLTVNFTKPIGELELYAFANYRETEGSSNAFWRRAGQDENVRAIYPNGFLPFVDTDSIDYNVSAGLRGDFAGGWQWDLSTIYGGNQIEYGTHNTVNATLGVSSPTAFYNGGYENSQFGTDLSFSGSVDLGWSAPLNLAFGIAYRQDTYEITAGELGSYQFGPARVLDGPNTNAQPVIGSQGFVGIQPIDVVDVDRDNVGLFVEASTDLTENWLVTAAGRFENYSDFGETWNGQLATRYELFDGFALRASVSNGFHAPSLAQQYYGSSVGRGIINLTTGDSEFFLVKLAPTGSPLARALGATDLEPEQSLNISAGLTWDQGPWRASLDFYRINIDDRIVLSSNFVDGPSSTALRDYLTSIGQPGVLSVRYFTNAVDTETQGFDLTVSHSSDLGEYGDLRLTAAYNYNETEATRIAPTPSQVTALGITTPLFDITERTRLERGTPRDKFALGANWHVGRFQVNLNATRYGEVQQLALQNQSPANVALAAAGGTRIRALPTQAGTAGNYDVIQILEPDWVTDLSVGADLTENVTLTFGANNIFNVYPTENIRSTAALAGADSSGVFPYSEFSPFGFSGAYYYTRLSVSF
ncbi:MAG: TonB-dependent receptor [Terricaulis sp.]